MSLEIALAENTKALLALTALMAAGATAKTATTAEKTPAAEKTAAAPAKAPAPASTKSAAPKLTLEQVKAILVEVADAAGGSGKDEPGVAVARTLYQPHGFKKMGEITEDKFKEIFDAAKAKLEELKEGGEAGDGDDDM